ncbi:MAG: DNA-processing protein DprA, partial [bacterium]
YFFRLGGFLQQIDDEKKAWIILNMFPEIRGKTFFKLWQQFNLLKDVFNTSFSNLEKIGLNSILIKKILNFEKEIDIEKELKLIKELNVKILTLIDDDYPANLKTIYTPPPLLYVKGELKKEDQIAIAIVGSRRTTVYGREICSKISNNLVNCGLVIVSGLARGIDTVAHYTALNSKGRTIAVLGTGINVIYPSENKSLMEKIILQGAVITEFPINTNPYQMNFPLRNRIISGLSLGTVVIEAGEKSGALITANYALEQNREVFAVPGNITSSYSKGTNKLIKQGAKLVEDVDDIINELQIYFSQNEIVKQKNVKEVYLENEEKLVYQILSEEPIHIEKILKTLNFSISKVLVILMKLEIKKVIKQLPGKFFIKN